MKNKNLVVLLVLVLIASAFTGCVQKVEGTEAATVNGESISIEDYKDELLLYKNMYESQYGPDIWTLEMEEGKTFERHLKEVVLDTMVLDKALEQEALNNGFEVTEEELDEQFDIYKEQFPSEEDFDAYLKSNNLSEDYIKNSMKKDQLINKYINDYVENIDFSEEELKDYYDANKNQIDSVKASHILVKDPVLAQDILAKLYEGGDFEELAAEHSIDGSAQRGGDLGYFKRGDMIPEFEEVAFSLETGELSGLVESQYGIHIIKVMDRKVTFEDNREDLKEALKNQKYNEKLEEVKENAEIEKIVDYEEIDLGIEESPEEVQSEEDIENPEDIEDAEEENNNSEDTE